MTGGTAVIQPLPGIGDMVWHLPHIRALAAHFGGGLTLIAKPRSAADQVFAAETTVADVLWLDRNPERGRGTHDGPIGLARLVRGLRRRRFDRVVILHHSRTLAMACMAAAIPERYGYGFHHQRPFLNRPPNLPLPATRLHPFQQASVWLKTAGIPVEMEPRLPVMEAARQLVRARVGQRPFVVMGIGSSEPYKQWGGDNFATLAAGLARAGFPRLLLAGGMAEGSMAAEIVARAGSSGADVTAAIGWTLSEVAALCAEAVFYVGNDTGVMNLAAAVGTKTYGLFGAVPPFGHASHIVPILPIGGAFAKTDGMSRITPRMVLAEIGRDRDADCVRPTSSASGMP